MRWSQKSWPIFRTSVRAPNSRMPAQFVVGASVQAAERLTLFFDYQWVDWSVFDTVTLDFENPSTPDEHLIQGYRDTNAVRLGGELAMTTSLRLRTGYAFAQAAAPNQTVTPLLPEAKRNHLTAGLGWTPKSNMTVDLAYQLVRPRRPTRTNHESTCGGAADDRIE